MKEKTNRTKNQIWIVSLFLCFVLLCNSKHKENMEILWVDKDSVRVGSGIFRCSSSSQFFYPYHNLYLSYGKRKNQK